MAKAERRRRAEEALEVVRLGSYGERKPAQMSGGQRQRVALARALVNRPKVLLLDEPLGALDLKLREQMQVELKAIQRQVGITFVFVTHDQEEALTMSDRIVVFNAGRIEQVGHARRGVRAPRHRVRGRLRRHLEPAAAPSRRRPSSASRGSSPCAPRRSGSAGVDEQHAAHEDSAPGTVREVVYVGSATRFVVDLDAGGSLVALQQNHATSSMDVLGLRDARVRLVWSKEHEFRVA